jgi:uncharacterized protein YggE
MRKLFISLILLSSSALYAQTGVKNFIDQNYIEVTGKSSMEVTPDEIYIKIILNEKDIKGKTLTETEKSMFGKLTEMGFNLSKDLAIKDLLSNFQHYWLTRTDILLSKEYQLLVHDAKTAGKVFMELQKLGISNVSIDRVENSKITEYRKEVKVAAIKAAQEKAKALTMAINQDLGRAIYIQEVENNADITGALSGRVAGIRIRGYFNTVLSEQTESGPDIEFEKIQLEYNVIVRFELK